MGCQMRISIKLQKIKKTFVNLIINVLMSPFYATFTISLQLWLNKKMARATCDLLIVWHLRVTYKFLKSII